MSEKNFILDIDEIRRIEKTYNWNIQWDSFRGRTIIGSCVYLYKKYGCPESYQEFYDSYINDPHKGDCKYHGRNEEQLKEVATKLQKKINLDLPFETYYNWVVKKIIVDTLDGAKKELELKKVIEKNGKFYCKEPNPEEDTKLGVDYFVHYKENGSLACIIQCKPNSFFLGNWNDSLIFDRKNALNKEYLCNQKFNVPVYYTVYDKNQQKWARNSNDSIIFRLNELINNDGTTKVKEF